MKIYNVTRSTELASSAEIADSWLSRGKGLLGRSGLAGGEGLVIRPCNSIHTFFMRFPIDVLFVDKQSNIVHELNSIKPWRLSRIVFSSKLVIELPPGTLTGTLTAVGDHLQFEEN